MLPLADAELIARMAAFLRGIGLRVEPGDVDDVTVSPDAVLAAPGLKR
jgi:hypothetical protein